jgi:hypothetical protein
VLLLDPRHELRRLAAGESRQPDSSCVLRFVDSLAGVAPGYGTLHAPWSGPYHRADHGLLIAAEAGCTHMTLLPLPRSGGLTGVYNVGSHDGPIALAALEPAWLEHIGAQALASAERQLQRARLRRCTRLNAPVAIVASPASCAGAASATGRSARRRVR